MFKLKRRPTPPGTMLREDYLKPRRISVAKLAAALGCSRKHLSQIVNNRVRLEPDMAARLARVLGTSTRFWVNLQANVDAYDADRAARKWKPSASFRAKAA
jgi:addiction module HigA family antidote